MVIILYLLSLANAQTLYHNTLTNTCELNTSTPPLAFDAVCGSNIYTWTKVPHDWDTGMDGGDGTCRASCQAGQQCDAGNNYAGKDWWEMEPNWQQKIATGQGKGEKIGSDDRQCKQSSSPKLKTIYQVDTEQDCAKACFFLYSTNEANVRSRCQYYDYITPVANMVDDGTGTLVPRTRNVAGVDVEMGGVCNLYRDCHWALDVAPGYKAYRLVDIYPAGFKAFSLREFNEPPTCIHVPNSRDKKVEVMIETSSKDSRVCIMDGNDMGIGTNSEVGNVKTCDNGQLYACFTAATRKKKSGVDEDFYFYIFCDGSCEASDVDLWVRIRVSDRPWSAGKTDTESDIEMWCEMERGAQYTYTHTDAGTGAAVSEARDEFTWPSELLPDYPDNLPFRINHLSQSSARMATVSPLLLALLGAALSLL